jgi:hypothetical protein
MDLKIGFGGVEVAMRCFSRWVGLWFQLGWECISEGAMYVDLA